MTIQRFVLAILIASTPLSASIITYEAALSGANENPATASLGTGFAVVTVDTIAQTMRVQVTFSGLTTGTTASHIHCCIVSPGNAGVATTTPTFPGFPLTVTSGTYDQTFDMTLASSYNPTFVANNGGTALAAEAVLFAGIAAGQSYLNIHTTMFPGGEIRGILAIPEPTTAGLAGFALAGLWFVRRRLVRPFPVP
jgi:hypothetical protein